MRNYRLATAVQSDMNDDVDSEDEKGNNRALKVKIDYEQIPNAQTFLFFYTPIVPRGAGRHYTDHEPLTTHYPASIRIQIGICGVNFDAPGRGLGQQLIDSWSRIRTTGFSFQPAKIFSNSDQFCLPASAESRGHLS